MHKRKPGPARREDLLVCRHGSLSPTHPALYPQARTAFVQLLVRVFVTNLFIHCDGPDSVRDPGLVPLESAYQGLSDMVENGLTLALKTDARAQRLVTPFGRHTKTVELRLKELLQTLDSQNLNPNTLKSLLSEGLNMKPNPRRVRLCWTSSIGIGWRVRLVVGYTRVCLGIPFFDSGHEARQFRRVCARSETDTYRSKATTTNQRQGFIWCLRSSLRRTLQKGGGTLTQFQLYLGCNS